MRQALEKSLQAAVRRDAAEKQRATVQAAHDKAVAAAAAAAEQEASAAASTAEMEAARITLEAEQAYMEERTAVLSEQAASETAAQEAVRHPVLKLNTPPCLFCMSWCPDFEFRGTQAEAELLKLRAVELDASSRFRAAESARMAADAAGVAALAGEAEFMAYTTEEESARVAAERERIGTAVRLEVRQQHITERQRLFLL